MSERFYLPNLPDFGYAELPPEEAHHAVQVMRVKPGDELTLFDGKNREATAVVCAPDDLLLNVSGVASGTSSWETGKPEKSNKLDDLDRQGEQSGRNKRSCQSRQGKQERGSISGKSGRSGKKSGLTVEIRTCGIVDRESACELTIAVALPKGDRQKWLIEKCAELGVRRILLLDVERSVARPEPQVVERLERQVIEASKQCRRNFLMEITPPYRWSEFLEYCRTLSDTERWLAHPGGAPISSLSKSCATRMLAAIGPEGGFTEQEASAACDAGFQSLSLGKRILRIETAAVAIASLAIRD